MAKQITQEQVIQKDLWQNTIDSTNLLIDVVDKLDASLKSVAEDSKKALAGNKKNDFGGLKGADKEVKKVNKAFEDKIKLDKQRIKLEDKIRQGRKVQSLENEKLNQQLIAEKKNTKELAKQSLALTGSYAKESKILNDLRKKYKNLAVSKKENTKEGKALLSQIRKLDTKLKGIDKTVGQSQRNVGNYTSAFGKLGGFLKNGLGFLGLTAGIAGLTRVLGGAIKIAKDFEQGNANLASVLGTSKDQITALTDDAKRLGSATSFSATQVSTLQTEFAKLGFNEKEILNATEATLDLAAATGSDLGEAAAIAGATLGGFGLDASETGRIADVMAKSFSTSALDMEKFKESMKSAAPAAKAVGINVETTTALLGTLANAGISGSKAGNNLKTSFINLNAAGLTLEQGLEKVANSEDKLGTAAKLVGKNAAASFLVLADGVDVTKELEKGLNNAGGAAKKMADEQLDTLEGKTKILASAWEGLVLSLLAGDGAFSSISKSLVEAATSMLSFLTASEDVVEVTYENAIANKELAQSAETLLAEYESLTKDGIEPTKEEKERLNEITLELKDSLGDSVVAIDKETGAFTLNTEAVRTQIKLKRFASDQEAATLASRLKGVQEEIKRREFDKKVAEQELATRKQIADEAVKEFNATTKLEGKAKQGARSRLDESEKLVKSGRILGDVNFDLAKKREEELDLIEKLKNLNFTAADVEALFTDEIKKNTIATEGNSEATKKRSKIKVEKINEELTLLQKLKEQLDAVNKAREKIVFTKGSETAFDKLTEDGKKLENQIQAIQDKLDGKEEPKKKLKTRPDDGSADAELKRLKDEAKEEFKVEVDNRKKVLATLEALNNKFFDDKKKKADEEIDSTKERGDALKDLAAQGNEDAAKSLGQNQKDQAEANKKKEDLLQKEKQFELALAVIGAFNSELDSGKTTGQALTSAITSTSVLTSAIAALPSFFDGTTDTGNGGSLDSNGGHMAMLHDNERVVDKKNNSKMGGVSNDAAANIVHDFNNDLLSYNSPQLTIQESKFDTNEQILSKFDTLEKSIVSAITNKETYLGSDIDTMKKLIMQNYSKGSTKTKVLSKYPTRR